MSKSKKYYWLKLKDDFFRSKEIKKLRKVAGGDTYTIIYLKMQLLSIQKSGIIEFDGTEKDLAEQLALELDESSEDVKMTLSFMNANKLIEAICDESYLLNKVPELIGSETDAAERMRKMRNSVTPLLQNVTQREEKREKRKELDIEIEKDTGKSPKKSVRFSAPTLEEVKTYCLERKNNVDAQRFIDHYEANGWYRGKNKIKDWKACIRTWESKEKENGRATNTIENKDTGYTGQYI